MERERLSLRAHLRAYLRQVFQRVSVSRHRKAAPLHVPAFSADGGDLPAAPELQGGQRVHSCAAGASSASAHVQVQVRAGRRQHAHFLYRQKNSGHEQVPGQT